MSDMSDYNEKKPSSADSLNEAADTISEKVTAGTEAVKEAAAEASARAGEVYRAGNEIVANRVDPLLGIATAAVAGLVLGYFLGASDRR